jgi:hypothetical protein
LSSDYIYVVSTYKALHGREQNGGMDRNYEHLVPKGMKILTATESRKSNFQKGHMHSLLLPTLPPPKITNHKLLAPLRDFKRGIKNNIWA